MLSIQKLSKQSDERTILNNISFKAKAGEITAILGPSGSGKTTLLRCLAQITDATFDEMSIDGIALNSLERGKIGLVFQSFNLFPNLTIKDNLILAPITHGMDKSQALTKANGLLEQFGLLDKLNNHPHQLSGGQKQRIAIARALMLEPPILLFDEPTSALDPEMVHEVGNIIKAVKSAKRVILIVTHELRLAKQVADHVLFLDQGALVDDCDANEFFKKGATNRSARSQKFLENFE